MAKRQHYTVKCRVCGKVIYNTLPVREGQDRAIRYDYCGLHRYQKRWNHRDAPIAGPK